MDVTALFTSLSLSPIELALAATAATTIGLGGYGLGRLSYRKQQQRWQAEQQDNSQQLLLLQQEHRHFQAIEQQYQQAQAQQQHWQRQYAAKEAEATQLREQLQHSHAQQTQLQRAQHDQRDWYEDKVELLQQQQLELITLNQKLQTTQQEKQRHFEVQLQLIEESKQQLKVQFEQLAADILERKSHAFQALNHASMANILGPIHAELKGFKDKVETIHHQETEQRTKLRTELENMQKLNLAITAQADKLTNALQGQHKVQGNWGELMLEKVLDNAGLRLGVDYERERSFNTEEGRLRPDVLIHLPQNKHLVIDAKTSLNAYTRYVNAVDADSRQTALKQHIQAIQARIHELASKNYHKLPGLNSPDVVIMFIPVESAYIEALKADDALFQRALDQRILVATPTTLLTSLNIVRQLWRFEDQNQHSLELARRAEKFHTKLCGFLESMEQVGKQLDHARLSYERAMGQLHQGRGNLIKQASEFKDLGIAVQKELPPSLLDKANLELPEMSASPPSAMPSHNAAYTTTVPR